MSISPIFYEQFFVWKFLCSFYVLTIWVCNFLAKGFLAQKLLIKCWWNWQLESISPTNLHNAQRCRHDINVVKDAVMFHQHFWRICTACFRLELLCQAPYFGTFLPNAVPFKASKIICANTPLFLAIKCWWNWSLVAGMGHGHVLQLLFSGE